MPAIQMAVDLDQLAARCTVALRTEYGDALVERVQALPGGASSFTFKVSVANVAAEAAVVVAKVAPPGLAPVRNRDVLRQARLLRDLAGYPQVPVPRVLAELPDLPDAAGQSPGYLMTCVPGTSYEPNMDGPDPEVGAEQVGARMARAVKILCALHSIDADLTAARTEAPIGPADEVARWARSLETVDAEFRVDADELRDRLLDSIPEPGPSALCHGDYRLGNMLAEGGDIRAVIDWEIWARSDPRIDLSWLLMLLDRRSQPLAVWQAPGLPTEAEVVRAYELAQAHPVERLAWFDALVRYKQAAMSALVVKNNRRRAEPDPAIERHAANPVPSIAAGLERLRHDV